MFKIEERDIPDEPSIFDPAERDDMAIATKADAARTTRGESTRALILETALQMFLEDGFESTTMRGIAERAGVTPSHAYYYFRSKESLVQAFYAKTHREHLAATFWLLQQEKDLEARLLGAMRAKLDTVMPYRHLAGSLFRIAADPRSPLNPFSEESKPVREEATRLFGQVLAESATKIPPSLAAVLPRLLWMYHMGVIMFWVHDDSPGSSRSFLLVERSVPLLVQLIRLSKLPPFRPALRAALRLLDELGFTEGDLHRA